MRNSNNQPPLIKRKITTLEMEIALMKHFNYRQNVIIPNISWGLDLHECDLLIVRKSLNMVEVEIKATKHDLLKDFEKKHSHVDKKNRIREFYYAMPRYVFDKIDVDIFPINSGIIVFDVNRNRINTTIIRNSKINTSARKLTESEYNKILRLGTYRIFTLKNKLHKLLNKTK